MDRTHMMTTILMGRSISGRIKRKYFIFSVIVGPGYADTRAATASNRDKSHHNGNTYDSIWQYAVNAQTE